MKVIDLKKCKDMSLVFTMIILGIFLQTGSIVLLKVGFVLTVVTVFFPIGLKPIAFLWFNLAEILNYCATRLILSIIFYGIVSPMAIIKKIVIGDSLDITKWPSNKKTLFVKRDVQFSASDLEHPF